MKRILILFLLVAFHRVSAQNEFAATAFYNEFNKICTDSQSGFESCRGTQRKSPYDAIQSEFRTKCMLPLADSGKLVIPKNTNPYLIYYFEPDKVRLKIDQLAVNLRDAILTAFNKPLYSRTETFIVKNYPYTNTLFFAEPEEDKLSLALFRQSIFFNDGKYYLSFEIFGKKSN